MKLKRGLIAALLALPVCVLAQSKSETSAAGVPALYDQALSAIQSGQLDLAAQLLQQVVQQHPDWEGWSVVSDSDMDLEGDKDLSD